MAKKKLKKAHKIPKHLSSDPRWLKCEPSSGRERAETYLYKRTRTLIASDIFCTLYRKHSSKGFLHRPESWGHEETKTLLDRAFVLTDVIMGEGGL